MSKGLVGLKSALGAFGLLIVANSAAQAADQARVLSSSEKAMIAKSAKDQLKDPSSAQFKWPKWIYVHDGQGSQTYCGLVNAKNVVGGYVGDRPFAAFIVSAKPGSKFMEAKVLAVEDADSDSVNSTCAKYGYDLSSVE